MNIEFTAFLYRPRELHERISDLAVDLIGSLAACTNTTAKYGATGGGSSGGGGDAKDGKLAVYADLKKRYVSVSHDYEDAAGAVIRFVERLENPRDRMILRLRYAEILDMPQILERLKKEGHDITLRTLYNWHNDAVARAENLWLKKKEDEKL